MGKQVACSGCGQVRWGKGRADHVVKVRVAPSTTTSSTSSPALLPTPGPTARKGTCEGDVGGPLMLPSPSGSNGPPVQIGIISSFGLDCGSTEYPDVYAPPIAGVLLFF